MTSPILFTFAKYIFFFFFSPLIALPSGQQPWPRPQEVPVCLVPEWIHPTGQLQPTTATYESGGTGRGQPLLAQLQPGRAREGDAKR